MLDQLPLPVGDYWIDADQPAAHGQILEHLQIEKIDSKFIPKITVMRKATRDILIPPPETISFYGGIVLLLICLAFISFAGALGWASSVTTFHQVVAPITQNAVRINNQTVFGRSVGGIFNLDDPFVMAKIAINAMTPTEQPLDLTISPSPNRGSIGIFDYSLISYGRVTFHDTNGATVGEIKIEPKEKYGTHRGRLEMPLSAASITQTAYPGFGGTLNLSLVGWKREVASMTDLQARGSPQSKEKVGPADLAFVAFVVIITAIAVMLTLGKIYFQNPG